MHLLAAQAGALQAEGEAIDLGQAPGRYVYASSADSELAGLAAAADSRNEDQLRLAQLMRLTHNLSVDLWLDAMVRHAGAVVVRLIGGAGYWRYGCDELETLARSRGIALALLPGDAQVDPTLLQRSTVSEGDWHALHAIAVAGGAEMGSAMLAALQALAEGRAVDPPGRAPRAFGIWHDGTLGEALPPLPAGVSVPILFYRALLEGAGAAVLDALVASLREAGMAPLPIAISSLKEPACAAFVRATLGTAQPAAILSLTGFALGVGTMSEADNPFALTDAPVIQLVQGSRPQAQWRDDPRGLTGKDLAMQVVLPELDGRIGALLVGHKGDAVWHARTQCPLVQFVPEPSGIAAAVDLVRNIARLRATPPPERRVAIVLANYPLRDGRLANGVGYDAPQSTVEILKLLDNAGYAVELPSAPPGRHPARSPASIAPSSLGETAGVRGPGLATGTELIAHLRTGPTNARPQHGASDAIVPLATYRAWLADLPAQIAHDVTAQWGAPDADPFVRDDAFHLPVKRLGNIAVLLQPARAWDRDEATSFHDPNLVPPHAYLAAYLWLRREFGMHALIHNGKHGNLEWLPGKAAALAPSDYPALLWGRVPHLYPFIVNDPGEGMQAKRRAGATIIDHLVPPLTRAETYGPLRHLEALLDEYYDALGMDRRRLDDLRRRILDFSRDARLDADLALPADEDAALQSIDTFLCELKEAQIRDGLHVFGRSPPEREAHALALAFARVPRGTGEGGDASLIGALADDLALGVDPLTLDLGQPWTGPRPPDLAGPHAWRSTGDTVERLEALALALIAGERRPDPAWRHTHAVLDSVASDILPRLAACGPNEAAALLAGLDGKAVAPGPSGAPSRGRLDTLPTGRNFYAVDNRAIPTRTAWELGQRAAEALLKRHFQDHGTWLASVVMSVWGTANMRTGGDDIAQAMALIGVRPTWQGASLTLAGYEIVPLARLGRPRVDVTLRISGLFRDAFPAQIALFDRAIRAIGALDEPTEDNPIAARMRTEALDLEKRGLDAQAAGFAAGHRIFGPAPGGYGTGVGRLVDSGHWTSTADLGAAAVAAGQFAYGAHVEGVPEHARFAERLRRGETVLHTQDNREHDLLDSDQYYQFEGGLAAAVETLSGRRPETYRADTSRPDAPRIRTLEEEVAFVMRSRVVNPKWIAGMARHGYRGAFEIVATVDFMFGFAATTGAVRSHHFDLAFDAFILDDATRGFLQGANPAGYAELLARFREARDRGLWRPTTNSAFAYLEEPA